MINNSVSRNSTEFAGYYEKPRSGLLDLLGSLRPRRVLEIGCGGGANLEELKRRFPICVTTGVELRGDAAEGARKRVDCLHLGNVLDERVIRFESGCFDLIILSHVLEHFVQPEQVLQRAKMWLARDGHLLIALPNVRHLSVLNELVIQGDFHYRSSGILDHTHFRFFTRRSAERFLAEQGLAIVRVAADVEGGKSKLIDKLTFGFARDFAAYAYNFLARQS